MQYIISNADDAEITIDSSGKETFDHQYRDSKNMPYRVISIKKKINGTYYVVVAVPDSSAKKMRIKSAYISKKIEVSQEFDANASNTTSKTNLDITSNTNLSQNNNGVNINMRQ